MSKVRALAKELTASEPVEELVDAVVPLLDAPDVPRRLLAVYLLGFASGRRPTNLAADPRAALVTISDRHEACGSLRGRDHDGQAEEGEPLPTIWEAPDEL